MGTQTIPYILLYSMLADINNNVESRKYGAYVISQIDYKGMVCAIDVSARVER